MSQTDFNVYNKMDDFDSKEVFAKLLPGATRHLRERGYWLPSFDLYPTLDGLICTVAKDYRYNQEYPHWGLIVAGTDIEVGISEDWFSVI